MTIIIIYIVFAFIIKERRYNWLVDDSIIIKLIRREWGTNKVDKVKTGSETLQEGN